ncbi:hypothetical protein [Pontixanthobacter aquaemixtae]|uniref:Hydroxyneurosporene synthase (CrtC) n=1 Tax=Pontixanthobacter aquaemixtae TaxID=1958940 RepID=A0A844ZRN9_9SPHN|nr:hypothetical protein [Pontixanthobacter aquaemixtae]MXO90184.1 hypothetical protein [Pontixanthobacter aquaemixtae]
MVLSKGDEYPLHQTAEPVAYSGTDRNFYDRYFFNGYAPDGSGFFALAFGVYPHLDVADAHFCVIRDGVQHCVHASCELGMERLSLKVGPISIEVIEPLQKLRLTIEETDGIAGEIVFEGRAFPIEEPRFTHRIGPRAFMDYTRMTQNGRYTGWVEVDGIRENLAEGTLGTRDRSWGVRPVGARDQQPMPGVPAPTFFWQWTPVNLPGGSLFFHLNADPDGTPWNTRAAWVPEGGEASDIAEGNAVLSAELQSGSRWPGSASLQCDVPGAPSSLRFEPVMRFQMRGLGYTSPDWGHGQYQGALKVEREDVRLAELNPLQPENLHVQMICRVETDAGETGTGIVEQLILGPYAPMKLNEYFDGGA